MERDSKPCVIESRKQAHCWGLPVHYRGGSNNTYAVRPSKEAGQAMYVLDQPGSEGRAESYRDNLGTWESLMLPEVKPRNRTSPSDQSPRSQKMRCLLASLRTIAHFRNPQSSRRRVNGYQQTGSLSSLILALESRETQPMRSL